MKRICLLLTLIIFTISPGLAQQKTTLPPNQKSGVQDIIRVVPELLPQAIRDSIDHHPVDKNAELTSAEEISKDGNLVYKVYFLKDEKTWSKTYDIEGRHLDKVRREETLYQSDYKILY